MTAKIWTTDMPEPAPDDIVHIEAMDFTWAIPWRAARKDVISGFAVMFIEDDNSGNTQAPEGA